ncbi:hypothetical protein RRG08_056839 [Elysia crispata]|uniref:Uncharacterized protein n=1 Tax=Elysia crispata TaxID=231223 RepID=A0AAE1ABL2_9GAST|nr:hypothetical protein RRG08_056839 [Elysia crispata]
MRVAKCRRDWQDGCWDCQPVLRQQCRAYSGVQPKYGACCSYPSESAYPTQWRGDLRWRGPVISTTNNDALFIT